jgi:hypothetical protein
MTAPQMQGPVLAGFGELLIEQKKKGNISSDDRPSTPLDLQYNILI